MEINYSKSMFAHITRNKTALSFDYKIGDNPLLNVRSFKYLGVIIHHDLCWRPQVEEVCSRAYRKLCFLRKKLQHAPKSLKLIAYKTFVRPVLEYASSVWSPHQLYLRDKLEKIQRTAVRFVCSRYRRTDSVTDMLKCCDLELLETRREKQRMKLFFQITRNQIKINKETYVRPPLKHSARLNHSASIQPYKTRLDGFQHSFFPSCIDIWNGLPDCTVTAQNVKEFYTQLELYYRQRDT